MVNHKILLSFRTKKTLNQNILMVMASFGGVVGLESMGFERSYLLFDCLLLCWWLFGI
jgi:hypothetical protein